MDLDGLHLPEAVLIDGDNYHHHHYNHHYNGRYGVLLSQVVVHHHGFGSVNGDIVGESPPLQLLDGVLNLAKVRVDAVNVDGNGVVVGLVPVVASVNQGVIDENEEAERRHLCPLYSTGSRWGGGLGW